MQTIDETLDLAITLLERGATGDTEQLASWVVDNLVHVLDELRSGSLSVCEVANYKVCRVGEQIGIVVREKPDLMRSEQARMLAAALLRAAEMADLEAAGESKMGGSDV